MGPRNRFQGINSASLCSLTGRYDNPIPTRCLAPIDFLKIPALARQANGIDSLESIPGLLKSLKIRTLLSCDMGCAFVQLADGGDSDARGGQLHDVARRCCIHGLHDRGRWQGQTSFLTVHRGQTYHVIRLMSIKCPVWMKYLKWLGHEFSFFIKMNSSRTKKEPLLVV